MSGARVHIDAQIQLRRDLDENWAKVDPVLLDGEVAYSKDLERMKVGDGAHKWSELDYIITDGDASSAWFIDKDGNLATDKNVVTLGDFASGAPGQTTTVSVTKIVVNGVSYPAKDGVIDMTKAFEGLQADIDLTPYAKTADIAVTYAKKTELEALQEGVNTSLKNIYTKTETDGLLKKYVLLEATSQTIKGALSIEGNLLIKGDVASSDPGQATTVGITGIKLNGTTHRDTDSDGVIDLGTIQVNVDLSGYLKTTDIAAWAKASTKPTYTKAEVGLGNVDNTADSAKSVLYAATAGSAPASDVYAWAKRSSLAASDVPDLSSQYLAYKGGLTSNINADTYKGFGFYFNETANGSGNSNMPYGYGYMLCLGTDKTAYAGVQLGVSYLGDLKIRTHWESWRTWKTIAFTDSTVAAAKKLTTGTYDYANFDESGKYLLLGNQTTTNGWNTYLEGKVLYFRTGANSLAMTIDSDGTVTIEKNLIVKGDAASGGAGASTVAFLPLTGGTINGSSTDPLKINSTATSCGVRLLLSGAQKAYVGYGTGVGAYIYNYDTGAYMGIDSSGVAFLHNGAKRTLLHDGNVGSYTAGSAYALVSSSGTTVVSHNAANNYVNVRGIAIGYGGNTIELTTNAKLYIQKNVTSNTILNQYGGNVQIGTDSTASYRLYVNGTAYATSVSQGSDIRFKNRKCDYALDLHSIANAPLFAFTWNDRDDPDLHLGTSAQYWGSIVPQLVSGTDFKALDYSTLGVAMGISLAKIMRGFENRLQAIEKQKATE